MIRFGPAAAPRWFDQSLDRFEAYLALLKRSGASAIEFVLLPGAGSEELGRAHVLEPQWASFTKAARHSGLTINFHAPLPAQFRLAHWQMDQDAYMAGFRPVLNFVDSVGTSQDAPGILVMHGAAEGPDVTAGFLDAILASSTSSRRIAIELRAATGGDDIRFDRDLGSLAEFVSGYGDPRVGICWDIAHDWERDGMVAVPDDRTLSMISHIHVHDSHPDGFVHAPLGAGHIPWQGALKDVARRGWNGSVTLEIRYRYASEIGEPWSVLEASLSAVRNVLLEE